MSANSHGIQIGKKAAILVRIAGETVDLIQACDERTMAKAMFVVYA